MDKMDENMKNLNREIESLKKNQMNFLEIYSIEIKISQNESVNSKMAQNKLFKQAQI